MTEVTIYHNPRCSKSRATLAILEAQQADIKTVKYLDNPPDVATIKSLLKKLNLGVRDILRNGESEYKEHNFADPHLSDDELITLLATHPKVMQRPIVSTEHKAVIGRPPENVLSLFND